MKLPPSIVVRIEKSILANYVAKNLKRDPYVSCEFWTNSYCLVSSAKNSVCKLSLLLLPWQQTMPQSEKKGIQSKFSTRQVFPSTLFCTFFFPFPPSTMSSTRWTGKNKEQSFAQTLCFFNCYCFMPHYVVSYFRWVFWFYASFNNCCWLTFIHQKRFVLFWMFISTTVWFIFFDSEAYLGTYLKQNCRLCILSVQ